MDEITYLTFMISENYMLRFRGITLNPKTKPNPNLIPITEPSPIPKYPNEPNSNPNPWSRA